MPKKDWQPYAMVAVEHPPWYYKDYRNRRQLSEIQKKLGIREKQRMLVINPPSNYLNFIGRLPKETVLLGFDDQGMDFVHAFFFWKKELEHLLPLLKYKIKKSGSVWISAPIKASRNDSDLSESSVRKVAEDNGMELMRNIAFNSQWSASMFVWPSYE